MIDYDLIPPAVKTSLDRWASHGQWPGENSFTRAVLENKLVESFERADDDNLAALESVVCYVYETLPGDCWGSPEKLQAWSLRFHPMSDHTPKPQLLGPGDPEVPV